MNDVKVSHRFSFRVLLVHYWVDQNVQEIGFGRKCLILGKSVWRDFCNSSNEHNIRKLRIEMEEFQGGVRLLNVGSQAEFLGPKNDIWTLAGRLFSRLFLQFPLPEAPPSP